MSFKYAKQSYKTRRGTTGREEKKILPVSEERRAGADPFTDSTLRLVNE